MPGDWRNNTTEIKSITNTLHGSKKTICMDKPWACALWKL